MIIPLILSVLSVTSGCSGSGAESEPDTVITVGHSTTSSDITSLQQAKVQWDGHAVQFYTIESQRFCQCLAEMSAQMRVSISNNNVLSAFDIVSENAISQETQQEIQTIDALFAFIEKAISDGVSIEVTYNEEYGYPETAQIDLEKLAVDGGLHIVLSNLEIKDSLLALNDVNWVLESFDSITGPVSTIENTNISMSIDMLNMQLNGVGGCNSYSAHFVLDNTKNDITTSSLISTEKACTEPQNIMQQEQRYFTALSQVRFFTFDDTSLNMVIGADAGLHFVAAQHVITDSAIDTYSNDLVLLQRAKTKWDSVSGQYYTIQTQRFCECNIAAHMEVSVLDNTVSSAIALNSGDVISQEIQKEILTVDSLFALIEKAMADGMSIEVTYNEEYGYPETVKLDIEQLAVDGGLHINLSNLEIKDSTLALDDISWTLEAFDSIAGAQSVIEDIHISLSIDLDNKTLSGTGGCNNYNADIIKINEKHEVTITNVSSDSAVCLAPEGIMQQEQRYFAVLEQVRFFTFTDGALNLTVGGDEGLHFVASN